MWIVDRANHHAPGKLEGQVIQIASSTKGLDHQHSRHTHFCFLLVPRQKRGIWESV